MNISYWPKLSGTHRILSFFLVLLRDTIIIFIDSFNYFWLFIFSSLIFFLVKFLVIFFFAIYIRVF